MISINFHMNRDEEPVINDCSLAQEETMAPAYRRYSRRRQDDQNIYDSVRLMRWSDMTLSETSSESSVATEVSCNLTGLRIEQMQKAANLVNNDELWRSFQQELRSSSRSGYTSASTNMVIQEFVKGLPSEPSQGSVTGTKQRSKKHHKVLARRPGSIVSETAHRVSGWAQKVTGSFLQD